MSIDLSVLVCSTHTRYQTFGPKIQEQVWTQYAALPEDDQARIEILMLTDNKSMMLGEKRNVMVDMAQGKYVVFVDDDDRIEPDYFKSLLDATVSDADAITFNASVSLNGEAPKLCRYSKDFRRDTNTTDAYLRIPNHICCVKKSVSVKASFPNLPYGEDSGYSKLLLPHLESEHKIDRVLYHYDYSDATTETQQARKGAIRTRSGQTPIVDVVVLSNAKDAQFRRMTQDTINSCVSGANSLPVNIIVLEQNPGVSYRNARTVHAPETFNYNRFANRGARLGSAEWIMVANNDLIFEDGWLHQLLAAGHPFVSPKCPDDARQADLVENTVGDRTGRNMSGWCFMVKRSLWDQIGGFDDCVDFWASDDVTIEQCRAVGVLPMLVPAARVKHLGSKTLKSEAAHHDDLTWRNIKIFSDKYGPHRLTENRHYREWLACQ